MSNALNYLKLDLRMIKDSLKYFISLPFVFILLSLKESSVMGLGYIFFLLVIIAATPFSTASSEKCDKMYYMFPSKISNMVIGRYLFLLSIMLLAWIVDSTMMSYLYKTNAMNMLEITAITLSGSLATIFCFVQYPIYYKFGIEKGKIISSLLYMVPGFVIFALPSVLKESSFLSSDFFEHALSVAVSNRLVLPLLIIVIIGISGFLSLSVSCSICKKKEL